MSTQGYEIVDHTADWALRVTGSDLRQLLIHAAQGMTSLLVDDVTTLPLDEERQIELEAYDPESLLVEWLSELAYWAETEQLLFRQFIISEVTSTHLQATVRGGRAEELHKHIKAVTYHNLEIRETAEGLETTVVFDV